MKIMSLNFNKIHSVYTMLTQARYGNFLEFSKSAEYNCTFQSVITNTVWPPTFAQSDGFWTDLNDLRFDGTKTSSGRYNWGSYIPLDNNSM